MFKQFIAVFFCLAGLSAQAQQAIPQQDQQPLPVHLEGLIVGAEGQKMYISSQKLGGAQRPLKVIDIDSTRKIFS